MPLPADTGEASTATITGRRAGFQVEVASGHEPVRRQDLLASKKPRPARAARFGSSVKRGPSSG